MLASVLGCAATHRSPESLFPHTSSNIHVGLQRVRPSKYIYEGPERDSVLSKDTHCKVPNPLWRETKVNSSFFIVPCFECVGLVPSLHPAKPAVRLGGTHVLWARCRARLSGLFWGRSGDGTQGLGHGRHTLCPWVHLPHFVLLTQPAWVLGKLAGASQFPLVVFPAWFPVRCAWFSLATSGLGWAGGQDLGARHTCSGGVRGARATPMFALDQAQVQQLFVFSTCTHCLRVF